MPIRISLLVAVLLIAITLTAQRDLEYVTDITTANNTVTLNNRILISGNGNSYIEAFHSEHGMSRYLFPFVDGDRLTYLSHMQPAVYNSRAYYVLWKGADRYLYQFNGNIFTRISIPGTIVSNPVVFGDNLYFLLQTGSTIQLHLYNGATVSAVTSGTIPATNSYYLKVAGDFLYLIGQGYYASEPYTVKRYNGSSFTTLPDFSFLHGIDEIYAVGSNAYLRIGFDRILYFNGSDISTIYDVEGSIINAAAWGGSLYFLATIEPVPTAEPLYRVDAGTLSEIAMPAGARIFHGTNLAVYNDAIYLQANFSATDNRVIRYDGASFTDFFTIPGTTHSPGPTFTREGHLIIQPEIVNGRFAYEYDGSSFTQLRAPEGHLLASYLNSTDCHHLWLSLYYDKEDAPDPHRWALLKESKGCPPPSTPVLVIPEHFFEFERADFNIWGKDRGWCWNEIIIDWVIEPCKFPDPCPEPDYVVSMFDKNNKLAWKTRIEKPSVLDLPLKDDQSYRTHISAAKGQQEDLFLFGDNLVEKGIESIGVYMKPGDKFFKLTATTDNGNAVPLRVELLGKNGQTLWQKDFTAPFSEQISDMIEEPGQTLRFSIPGKESKSIFTDLNIYPNPSKGWLYLQIKTDNEQADAELSIYSLLGQKILDRKIRIPFSQQIKLDKTRPGLYVVKIKTADGEQSRIIKVE